MRRYQLYVLCALCGPLGMPRSLACQGWPIILGDRVRVTAPTLGPSPILGTVLDRRVDALILRRGSGDTITVPIASLARVEVSYGHHRHPFTGAIVGVASGAVIGGVLGALSKDTGPLAFGRAGQIAVGVGVGSAAGTVVGAGIGAFVRTDRWHDAAVAPAPTQVISAVGSSATGASQHSLAGLAFPVSWFGH
jgi:hypothetical protein